MTADPGNRRAAWAATLAAVAEDDALPRLASIGWRFLAEPGERERALAGLHDRYGADPVLPVFQRDGDLLVLQAPRLADSEARPVLEIHAFATPEWTRAGAWRDVGCWILHSLKIEPPPARDPVADLDDVLRLLGGFDGIPITYASTDDIVRWSIDLRLSPAALLDRLAAYLVEGFHRGALDYDYCDVVANILHFPILDLCAGDSFAWDTYLAFDDGEHHHHGTSQDPVEDYTRPQVAALFARLQARGAETAQGLFGPSIE